MSVQGNNVAESDFADFKNAGINAGIVMFESRDEDSVGLMCSGSISVKYMEV